MQELIKKIEQWAIDRGIDNKGTVEGQSIKTAEEIAELIKGISKDNIDLIKDSIGDVFVTLVIGNMLDKKFDIEELIKYAKDLIVGDEIEWEKDKLIARLGSNISDIAEYKYEDADIEFTLAVIIYASQFYNLDFKDCVESAYKEIANGTFLKNGKEIYEGDIVRGLRRYTNREDTVEFISERVKEGILNVIDTYEVEE